MSTAHKMAHKTDDGDATILPQRSALMTALMELKGMVEELKMVSTSHLNNKTWAG